MLVAVPLLVYGRTVTFDYVNADDVDLIAGNQPFLRDLANLPDAFRRSYFETGDRQSALKTYYRPIAIVSFMVDAQSGGPRPGVYHLTNVVLHTLAVVLLYRVLLTLGASAAAALLAALLFAVHPLNAQAVGWIAGRNELLFGVFTLAACEALVRWTRSGRRFWLALHLAAFALALFSKETAVLIPVVAVAAWMIWRPAISAGSAAVIAAGYAIIVACWSALRAAALAGAPATGTLTAAAANVPQLLVHLGKLVIPMGLNVMPGTDRWAIFLGAVGAVVTIWALRRLPARTGAFCAGWILLFLAPTLLVPDLPAYEHRMYVPFIGAAIAVAQLLTLERATALRASALVAAIFAVQTSLHLAVFRDPVSYWQNGSRSERYGAIADVNLGQLHEQSGNLAAAQDAYRRALARAPDTPKAHNNLGVVLMQLQQAEAAAAEFREETRRHPWNPEAWFNLGLWAEMKGDAAEARRNYERAIAADPEFLPAREKLGLKK